MKIVVKERKMGANTKILVDAQEVWKWNCEEREKDLFSKMAKIFKDAYKEGVLVTDDYRTLCDIAIKEMPSISQKGYCDLQMTRDRVIMKVSGKSEEYKCRIRECFEQFYGECGEI